MNGGLGVWDGAAGAVVVEVRGAVLGYGGYVGVVVVEQVREAGAYGLRLCQVWFGNYYCACHLPFLYVPVGSERDIQTSCRVLLPEEKKSRNIWVLSSMVAAR